MGMAEFEKLRKEKKNKHQILQAEFEEANKKMNNLFLMQDLIKQIENIIANIENTIPIKIK